MNERETNYYKKLFIDYVETLIDNGYNISISKVTSISLSKLSNCITPNLYVEIGKGINKSSFIIKSMNFKSDKWYKYALSEFQKMVKCISNENSMRNVITKSSKICNAWLRKKIYTTFRSLNLLKRRLF